MKKFRAVAARLTLALALAMAYLPSMAAMQARDEAGTTVTLLETPCLNADSLALLPKLNELLAGVAKPVATADQLHAGNVFYKGKNYGACWVLIDGIVIVLDDGKTETSIFPVPAQAFRNVDGV